MIKNRVVVLLALVGVLSSASLALAQTDAPKTTATSKTLYLIQEECGTTSPNSKLLPTPGNRASFCGTAFGLPTTEVYHRLFGTGRFEDFTSTSETKPFKINAGKQVTGQLKAESFFLKNGGGVGTVTFDVKLRMETKNGTITFAPITVSQAVSTSGSSYVPFSMPVPKAWNGQVITEIVMSVNQRGANFPMSVFGMQGGSYLVIPAKK